MSADNAVPAKHHDRHRLHRIQGGLNANSSEEMMPLPYWKDPSAKTIMTEHWGVEIHILRPSFSAPTSFSLRLRARHEHLSTRAEAAGVYNKSVPIQVRAQAKQSRMR